MPAKTFNPSADLATLRELLDNFKLHHSPLDHLTVHEERRCERCRLAKRAEVALSDLEAHRAELNDNLSRLFG